MRPPVEEGCYVVIRAAGERTEAACARLAALEAGEGRVALIREVPFARAVRRGFEIGVEAGRDWTLCLDADVLLAPGSVAALCDAARAEWRRAPDLFEIEGLVADKLLGQLRPAGVHLYRTSLLAEALEHAAFDPRKRRPESRVKKQMRERGLRTVQVDLVSGLHDHEQFHRDIFRKVFTHARKHERFMAYAPRYWRRMAGRDADLRMAWLSWRLSAAINAQADLSGVPENEKVAIDLRAFPGNVDAILVPAGMSEKAPLPADGVPPAAVAAAIEAFEVAPEYLRDRPRLAARGGHWSRARASVAGHGLRGTVRMQAGRALSALARRLGEGEG